MFLGARRSGGCYLLFVVLNNNCLVFFLATIFPLFLVSVVFVFALGSWGDLLLIPYPELPYE